MSEFNIGDVVELKSGGPRMTVSDINDAGMVECKWFDKTGELKSNFFKQDVLKLFKQTRGTVHIG